MNRRVLDQLKDLEDTLEFSGLKRGTKRFEAAVRERRVVLCREFQGIPNCSECSALLACTLAEQHLRDVRYGVQDEPADEFKEPTAADPKASPDPTSRGPSSSRLPG